MITSEMRLAAKRQWLECKPLTNTGMSFAEYEYNLRHMNEQVQPALGAGMNGARIMQPGDKVRVPVWRRIEK